MSMYLCVYIFGYINNTIVYIYTITHILSHIFKYMYNIINAYIFKHIICLYISIHMDIRGYEYMRIQCICIYILTYNV